MKIKVGIPRALLYYKYKTLWINFFKKLNIEVVISPLTNKEILKNGLSYSIDEACLSSKVYMGHVDYLRDKCDYILIPRVVIIGDKQELCVKFFGLCDTVSNTFSEVKILDYNLDVSIKKNERKAFIEMGRKLGCGFVESLLAYNYALKCKNEEDIKSLEFQKKQLTNDNLKVLIVSHSYNTYDYLIGNPLIKYLKELSITPIFADIVDHKEAMEKANELSDKVYWAYNRELLGGIQLYKDKVDGIILISTFPCGPDSLVNEIIIRKVKDLPVISILLDEQDGSAGMITRIESFVDILKFKRSKKNEQK